MAKSSRVEAVETQAVGVAETTEVVTSGFLEPADPEQRAVELEPLCEVVVLEPPSGSGANPPTRDVDLSSFSFVWLAEHTGYCRSHISRVMRGQGRKVTLTCATRIANACGVTVEEFTRYLRKVRRESSGST